jgi:CubicO group peptidase (beta-lactamase class C family)
VSLSGCNGGDQPAEGSERTTTSAGYPEVTLADVDAGVLERVSELSLEGATLLVEADGARLHEMTMGAVLPVSSVPLGETGWWLGAATVMSLVEEGAVSLDAPVGEVLAWMTGPSRAITLRQLLSHTSGLPRDVDCDDAAECDRAIAGAALLGDPGSTFAVSAANYHVAARVAEAAAGRPWSSLVDERLLEPLAMASTTVRTPPAGPDDPAGSSPSIDVAPGLLAADGTTTAEDLGRFLSMVLARGSTPAGQVLVAASLEEMERDQSPRLDTSDEPWVAATGVPTYGLGVWRDRPRGDGSGLASMVSGPNQVGVYPYVDHARAVWAVLVVVDIREDPLDAVEASALTAMFLPPAVQRARATTSPDTTALPGPS